MKVRYSEWQEGYLENRRNAYDATSVLRDTLNRLNITDIQAVLNAKYSHVWLFFLSFCNSDKCFLAADF